jgi:acyl-CoA thioesterase-1
MMWREKLISQRRCAVLALSLLLFLALLLPTPLFAAAADKPLTILVVGDSLTAGYGLAGGDGFPARLERVLAQQGFSVSVRDGGVSGDTTSGGRARLAWMLDRLPAPNAVIIQLGANDALRGVDPAVTEANLAAMIEALQARNLPVLLAGMRAPPNMGEEFRQRFDAIFPALATRYRIPLYPFFLEGVAGVAAMNQADGIHPNAEGVGEIVRRITPDVVALIRSVPVAAPH